MSSDDAPSRRYVPIHKSNNVKALPLEPIIPPLKYRSPPLPGLSMSTSTSTSGGEGHGQSSSSHLASPSELASRHLNPQIGRTVAIPTMRWPSSLSSASWGTGIPDSSQSQSISSSYSHPSGTIITDNQGHLDTGSAGSFPTLQAWDSNFTCSADFSAVGDTPSDTWSAALESAGNIQSDFLSQAVDQQATATAGVQAYVPPSQTVDLTAHATDQRPGEHGQDFYSPPISQLSNRVWPSQLAANSRPLSRSRLRSSSSPAFPYAHSQSQDHAHAHGSNHSCSPVPKNGSPFNANKSYRAISRERSWRSRTRQTSLLRTALSQERDRTPPTHGGYRRTPESQDHIPRSDPRMNAFSTFGHEGTPEESIADTTFPRYATAGTTLQSITTSIDNLLSIKNDLPKLFEGSTPSTLRPDQNRITTSEDIFMQSEIDLRDYATFIHLTSPNGSLSRIVDEAKSILWQLSWCKSNLALIDLGMEPMTMEGYRAEVLKSAMERERMDEDGNKARRRPSLRAPERKPEDAETRFLLDFESSMVSNDHNSVDLDEARDNEDHRGVVGTDSQVGDEDSLEDIVMNDVPGEDEEGSSSAEDLAISPEPDDAEPGQ